ncbi:hypothetical protein VSR68_11395 [Paraburkholderia phymatum]|uniref:hypothetical protein n=1 Tax=Paraburkholderia phymatum TaxID=148447 RepID=UPI0031806458
MHTPEQLTEFRSAYAAWVDARRRHEEELLALFRQEKQHVTELIKLAAEADAAHKRFTKASAPFIGGRSVSG